MDYFGQLGSLVLSMWRSEDCDERVFPEIASHALSTLPPHEHVDYSSILDWALTEQNLPIQADINAAFGQPPLVVFWGEYFYIQILFWLDGRPAIHEHGFSGAFSVLYGSSIHSSWTFKPHTKINSRFSLGDLSLSNAELLRQGDIRPIIAGNELIHTTFHLERPSITVVVRTHQDIDRQPQMQYLYPSIAFAGDNQLAAQVRRAQIIRFLAETLPLEQFTCRLLKICSTATIEEAFYFLKQAGHRIKSATFRDILIDSTPGNKRKMIEDILGALYHKVREQDLLTMRARIPDERHRLILALLIAVPNRALLCELLSSAYPESNPALMVTDCIDYLSQSGMLNAQLTAENLAIMRHLLSGDSVDAIEQHFRSISGNTGIETLNRMVSQIRKMWIVEPILAGERESAK